MAIKHSNFAFSSVATAPSPSTSGTSLVVATGEGTLFPTLTGGDTFRCVICPSGTKPDSTNAEVVYVTARSTDTFTIARAQENSTSRDIQVGDSIFLIASSGEFDGLLPKNTAITGATKTKITYDANGLVTVGADATTADIADSTDKRYVTDAQLVVIGNTSNTNTGDQSVFKTIAVTSGTNPVADTTTDTLNLSAGTGITVTGDQSTDTVTIATTITQYTDELAQDAVGNAIGKGLDYDDTSGAIAVDETELDHNSLGSKQGGTTNEYYHLTAAQATVVSNTSGTNTGDQDSIVITIPATDHLASGIKIALTATANVAFGDVCYIASTGKATLVDADAIASGIGLVMCADATINADASGNWLLYGTARDDTSTWTVGGIIYISTTGTTGNTMTQTMPTGVDDVVLPIGVALSADVMLFKPGLDAIERT